ncbi:hypothetical protein E2C01_004708 [Portunus trituberculatus]|uniref:Uncharacterized protein n=1 Tax=Portunus trituberculatus TaxID=210409 RepID=A0A5B7CT13_PORTR|nr:hypothetical protein [Portunus trituberculatus]
MHYGSINVVKSSVCLDVIHGNTAVLYYLQRLCIPPTDTKRFTSKIINGYQALCLIPVSGALTPAPSQPRSQAATQPDRHQECGSEVVVP